MKGKKPTARKTFREAVLATPDVATCYEKGLQAFSKEFKKKIVVSAPKECGGSVELDECVKKKYPQENRWDFMFDYRDETYFVEFHSAKTDEVSTMIYKLNWLKKWLRTQAQEIDKLKAKAGAFIWVQSNGNHILKNSPQERRIRQAGLKPVAMLKLD